MNRILTFTLHGQLKSGKNRVLITRTGHRYPPKTFKVWREAMLMQIGTVAHPFVGSVSMSVDYVPGDKIRRDVPGMLDALCHVIEKAGLVVDDAQVKSVTWLTLPVAPKQARCVVTLEERP